MARDAAGPPGARSWGRPAPVKGILMSTSVARLTTPEGPGYATRRDLTPVALVSFWWPPSLRAWHTDEVTPLWPRPNAPGLAAS
jgi:hypothetical protein